MPNGMGDLDTDATYAITEALNARADEACRDGDADMRRGLYVTANVSYREAARWRRAAINVRDHKPLHEADMPLIAEIRARIERQLLAITEEATR